MSDVLKPTLRIRTTVDVPQADGDLIQLELEQTNKDAYRGRITANGKTYTMFKMKCPTDAVSSFLSYEPLALAELFDQVGAAANSIDGDWLVEHLLAKFEERDPAEDEFELAARIKRLTVVPNLMGLFSVGNDIMNTLYGHNWVVEQSASLIKQSTAWKALVNSVTLAQTGLEDALSS